MPADMWSLTPRLVSAALVLLAGSSLPAVRAQRQDAPTATVLNGTYAGVHNADYNQDYFLGIPYALAPTQGPLRFALPASLNTSWTGQRDATVMGDICYGYGVRVPLRKRHKHTHTHHRADVPTE